MEKNENYFTNLLDTSFPDSESIGPHSTDVPFTKNHLRNLIYQISQYNCLMAHHPLFSEKPLHNPKTTELVDYGIPFVTDLPHIATQQDEILNPPHVITQQDEILNPPHVITQQDEILTSQAILPLLVLPQAFQAESTSQAHSPTEFHSLPTQSSLSYGGATPEREEPWDHGDLSKLTVTKLKQICREFNIGCSGKKDVLIKNIRSYASASASRSSRLGSRHYRRFACRKCNADKKKCLLTKIGCLRCITQNCSCVIRVAHSLSGQMNQLVHFEEESCFFVQQDR